MNLRKNTEQLITVPENHTARIVIGGGTDEENLKRSIGDMVPEEHLRGIDETSSAKGLVLHPIVAVVIQGQDGHIHMEMGLPLQRWTGDLIVEKTVKESKSLQRVTDWVAGFMDSMCMNGTVSAYDLDTEQSILGGTDSRFQLPDIIKQMLPARSVPVLESIGNFEDILAGQMSNEEIESTKKEPPVAKNKTQGTIEAMAEFFATPAVPVATPEPQPDLLAEAAKMKKSQQDVVKKYGYPALVELAKKMNQPVLVKAPKV